MVSHLSVGATRLLSGDLRHLGVDRPAEHQLAGLVMMDASRPVFLKVMVRRIPGVVRSHTKRKAMTCANPLQGLEDMLSSCDSQHIYFHPLEELVHDDQEILTARERSTQVQLQVLPRPVRQVACDDRLRRITWRDNLTCMTRFYVPLCIDINTWPSSFTPKTFRSNDALMALMSRV